MRLAPQVLRRAVAVVAGVAALVTLPGGDAVATTHPPQAPYPAVYETFSSSTWYQNWGRTSPPWRTSMQAEAGNGFLRVHIPKGQHDGTSFFRSTADYDAVTLRYRIRLGPGWDPTAAAHNVKLPGFGSPRLAPDGSCLVGCGGAPADGQTGYSARVDVHDSGVPGFYVYDVSGPPLPYGRGARWAATPFVPGRWHTVEVGIAMNTPGMADGVLRASVDGTPVFDRTDLRFRHTDALHVGAAWFNFYYGGSGVAPADTTIDLDDVALFAGV